ncbi:MAG: hypothetical protein KGI54_17665 [Pseudomonadota bacterium]|nr:hypothetical protein [Pseudomonadota bacterium]
MSGQDILPRVIQLELEAEKHDEEIKEHASSIQKLNTDVVNIKKRQAVIDERLKSLATKDDIHSLHLKIDESVTDRLKEANAMTTKALDSVPVKQSNMWAAIMAISTIGLLIVTAIQLLHP